MSREGPIRRVAIHDWGTHPCPPRELQRLLDRTAGIDCEFTVRDADTLADCDAVVTLFHHDEFLEEVEWVHNVRSGYDDFPLDAYRDAGVTMTNSTGVAGDLVGETAVTFMLTFAKGLHRFRDQQNTTTWRRLPVDRPFELGTAEACVVGLGELGGSVVSRAGVLGMDVVGVDVRPVSNLGLDRVYDVNRLTDAVGDARFVVLTTPLTDQTEGLVGRDVFEAMRDDAYLVNVSRGEVVDQDALVDALKNDEIAGAALDVFHEEPLPGDSPLWELDDVVVTPHAAAQADNYGDKIADLVETNVARLNDGQEPWNRVV
ncbi:NAD(P)-dependent oxidoreductase [Halobaculum sp. P14]|uniref:NAD(P)-dependent oxidoreductase n=1 Tax=Halobaculum sp. P14 TaxID=3421638 RepID=UPI003EBF191A